MPEPVRNSFVLFFGKLVFFVKLANFATLTSYKTKRKGKEKLYLFSLILYNDGLYTRWRPSQ